MTINPGSTQVTVSHCPAGFDKNSAANAYVYSVYLGGGTPEVKAVSSASTCSSGSTGGTIVFTSATNGTTHTSVGAANSGLQEAFNQACYGTGSPVTPNCRLDLPASGALATPYHFYAPFYAWGTGVGYPRLHLNGNGAYIYCHTTSSCMYFLVTTGYNVVEGLRFTSTTNVDGTNKADGALVTNISSSSNTCTVTTATAHNLSSGDSAYVRAYYATGKVEGIYTVGTVTDSTHFAFTPGTGQSAVCTMASVAAIGSVAQQNSVIEDNADGSIFRDIKIYDPYPPSNPNYTPFNIGFVNDNDQAMVVDHFAVESGGPVRCTSNYCGSVILGRGDGPNSFSGILTLKNFEISLGCGGNGVDWQVGNTLSISDTVIQGYSQFGIRYNFAGGFGGPTLKNVYEEAGGACTNPLTNNVSQAGVIAYGSTDSNTMITAVGGELGFGSGSLPVFASGGATTYVYYVVANLSANVKTYPLPIGSSAPMGAGTVNLSWPQIPGAISYDVLRNNGTALSPPYYGVVDSNGNYVNVAVPGAQGVTTCANQVCTASDTQATLTTYGPQNSYFVSIFVGTYSAAQPYLPFWPGTFVLTSSASGTIVGNGSQFSPSLSIDYLQQPILVSTAGGNFQSVSANVCTISSALYWSPIWIKCNSFSNWGNYGQNTNVYSAGPAAGGSSTYTNAKGILNFRNSVASGPAELITLNDGNWEATAAYAGAIRAPMHMNDMFVGVDTTGTNVPGLSAYSPVSITNYVGLNGGPTPGDGTHWLERLTSSRKTFNVPVSDSAGSGFALTNSSGGTATGQLVKLTGAPSTGITAAATDTSGIVGICVSGCGNTQIAVIADHGTVTCAFDGAATAGHYVQISSSTAGDCHDAGATLPASNEIIGRVLQTIGGAGSASVLVQLQRQ